MQRRRQLGARHTTHIACRRFARLLRFQCLGLCAKRQHSVRHTNLLQKMTATGALGCKV